MMHGQLNVSCTDLFRLVNVEGVRAKAKLHMQ